MNFPHCPSHNVSWTTGKECPDCIADRLQARVKALEQQLHECGQSELKHDIRADELAIENAKLRKVVDAAQAFMNEIQCYSTGTSLMAEENMVELFAKYSDAKDEMDSKDSE